MVRRELAPTALLWVAVAGCALVWSSAATPLLEAMFRWIPNGYNEGWNAYWAEIAWRGEALYPAVHSPVSNNYPPLSFYIVGAVGRLIGDNIFAGRLLAFLSSIVVAVDLFAWLRIGGLSRGVAAFGATLFLAALALYAPAYITMNDPQLLAHALMITSAVVLWRWEFSRRALVGAAVLMVLAGMVKHLLIALPVAVTVWMFAYRRPRVMSWLFFAALLLGVALSLLYVTRGALFFHDMASSRLYSRLLVETGIRRVWESFGFLAVLGGFAVVIAVLSRRSSLVMREQAAFVLVYFVVSAGIGALAASGKGVDRNAFFDFLIATALAVAIGIEHVRARVASPGASSTGYQPGVATTPTWLFPMVGSVVAAGCCAVFLMTAARQWPAQWQLIQQLDQREAEALHVIGEIRRLGGGSAACEELSLCYWAGSAFKVDFFNYGQKLATSALSPADCDETFSARSISLVQVNSPPGEPRLSFRLPAACNAAIARKYPLEIPNPQGRLMLPAAE